MRIIYDDTMQNTLLQAVDKFMSNLNLKEITKYSNGMDRIESYSLKKKLNLFLQTYYHMEIGNKVAHAYGIGNNCCYPVYYHSKEHTEIQQCASININHGMYGEAYVNCEDYNGKRIGITYEIYTTHIKKSY